MIKFGTDGWRGIIADDFTFSNVRVVSQAISDYLKRQVKGEKKVVVGYDCRFLSREFAREVSCVLAANGIKVVLSNAAVPTPLVSFHSLYNRYNLGIMITASHNPAQFNGLKIKTSDGGAADKHITDKVEKLLFRSSVRMMSFDEAVSKNKIEERELRNEYIKFIKRFVDIRRIKELKLKILVDVMYGAGDEFATKILGGARIKIDYLHHEFNPSFGGVHPEPIPYNLRTLISRVKRENYDFGVALDGDADRIAVVSKKGTFISAQVLLPLLAIHMVKNRKEKGGIGKTVVGSNMIDEVALSLGVVCYETPVGFKYISSLFKEGLIAIGGEEAGGIGFKGYIPERDGTVSFLMLLEMMAYEGESLDELLRKLWRRYGHWYYMRTSLPLKKLKLKLDKIKIPRNVLGEKVERLNYLDGVKIITKNSWFMFRASGTEPIVRLYAEAKTKKRTLSLIDMGRRLIERI